MPEFKDRLKECRQAKGLRQQDAAEQLGIPTISVAAQLADFFEVSLDFLAGRSDQPT